MVTRFEAPLLQLSSDALREAAATFIPRQRLVVATQSPPANTPVVKGSTVEVTLVDLNQIPVSVLHPEFPDAVKEASVADVSHLVESTPELKAAIGGTQPVSETKAAELINLNSGTVLGRTLNDTEAAATFNALRSLRLAGRL